MEALLILLAGGITLTIGDLFAGKWAKDGKRFLYILTVIFYMIGLNFLVLSYKFKDIAVASLLLEIFNIATLTLVGIYFLKEKITRTELAGIVLGLLAVIILELQ